MSCQHPNSRNAGTCKRSAIGSFEVPPDYAPVKRHAENSDIPRPKANLCRQHAAKVEAHRDGVELSAGSHEAQCAICQSPHRERWESLWVGWILGTGNVLRESGVGLSTWYKHVEHFDLWKRKASKVSTRRALVIAAEKGFEGGGHSAKTALMALTQLSKERGDPVRVSVEIGGRALEEMTDEELALEAERLALQVREREPKLVGSGGGE